MWFLGDEQSECVLGALSENIGEADEEAEPHERAWEFESVHPASQLHFLAVISGTLPSC